MFRSAVYVCIVLSDFKYVCFQVLPTIVKLFASNDRAIRVGLLQHIDQYGESLSAQIVDEQVCCHYQILDVFLCSKYIKSNF